MCQSFDTLKTSYDKFMKTFVFIFVFNFQPLEFKY